MGNKMAKCCPEPNKINAVSTDPCRDTAPECAAPVEKCPSAGPLKWFADMIPNCLEYARAEKAKGRPIVGIMCEFTPREIIMAAGAVPVCLCGGSAQTIPAAEEHLPAGLCPLIKSTYGYHVLGKNPFLEMADLVVAETTCDGKKKMYELMARSRQMHVLELPQKPADIDAFGHWLVQIRKFKRVLEDKFSVEITESKLRDAICVMNRERGLRRGLASLMALPSPPLTGRDLLDCKSIISAIERDLAQYELIYNQLSKRQVRCDSARTRVLLTGVPLVHGAERVMDIIEGSGGIVVCMENCTGLKPILDDVDPSAADPLEAIARKYLSLPCSVMTPNPARLELLEKLASQYRPECIVELIWHNCLTYDVESFQIAEFAKQKLGLPYLRIETDYSPSDSARISMRIEALFETLRNRTRQA
jgi:benzoyl-CoA reductase/2-hydroxyglutaryl-CoA dehydratase subunit BcrC/BadD/HgdB